ncbi:MAG: ATP-grasp domain-containing protein [Bacteroidales bacterium]|nr:ATP-grasp domain-containing protein [Bacteroidales bacterium]
MMKKVLITDASQRKAVPIIRSLGKKGIQVVAGEDTFLSMGFYSKYTKKRVVYPSPENEIPFIKWLISSAKAGVFDILFPIDDRTMLPVTKYLNELNKHMNIPVADHHKYMTARNKARTMELAESLGIPVPLTKKITQEADIQETLDSMPIPAVIKATDSSGSRGLSYVFDRTRFYYEYMQIHKEYHFPLVQEYIPEGGNAYGVEVLCNNGNVINIFVHRRIREFPVKGGPSTLRESIYKTDIVDYAVKLMESLDWHGVAMVEFKENPQTGECLLMEINPRFWGSVALPIVAGVDFPYLLYQLACNKPIAQDNGYPEHVLCRWLVPGDILHFFFNPDRFRLKPSFFKFSGMFYDLVDIKDPLPVISLLLFSIKDVFDPIFWRNKILR